MEILKVKKDFYYFLLFFVKIFNHVGLQFFRVHLDYSIISVDELIMQGKISVTVILIFLCYSKTFNFSAHKILK